MNEDFEIDYERLLKWITNPLKRNEIQHPRSEMIWNDFENVIGKLYGNLVSLKDGKLHVKPEPVPEDFISKEEFNI